MVSLVTPKQDRQGFIVIALCVLLVGCVWALLRLVTEGLWWPMILWMVTAAAFYFAKEVPKQSPENRVR